MPAGALCASEYQQAGGASTNVIVTPASANYFTVTAPPQPFTATTGSAFSVAVQAFDRFGNAVTGYTGASAAAGAAAYGRSRAGRRPVRVDSRRRTMRILEFNPEISQ